MKTQSFWTWNWVFFSIWSSETIKWLLITLWNHVDWKVNLGLTLQWKVKIWGFEIAQNPRCINSLNLRSDYKCNTQRTHSVSSLLGKIRISVILHSSKCLHSWKRMIRTSQFRCTYLTLLKSCRGGFEQGSIILDDISFSFSSSLVIGVPVSSWYQLSTYQSSYSMTNFIWCVVV